MVGNQGELFSLSNTPAIGVFYGDEVVMHPRTITDKTPAWVGTVSKGYAMDAPTSFLAIRNWGRRSSPG